MFLLDAFTVGLSHRLSNFFRSVLILHFWGTVSAVTLISDTLTRTCSGYELIEKKVDNDNNKPLTVCVDPCVIIQMRRNAKHCLISSHLH